MSIQKRLKNASEEMKEGKSFEHWIVNDSLERAYQELKTILETGYHLPVRREMNG